MYNVDIGRYMLIYSFGSLYVQKHRGTFRQSRVPAKDATISANKIYIELILFLCDENTTTIITERRYRHTFSIICFTEKFLYIRNKFANIHKYVDRYIYQHTDDQDK